MQNSPPKLRRHTHPRETGIALVTVLIMIVLMATLVSITSILAIGNRKSGTDTVLGTKAQYAAEAGLENAMYQIYYKTKANYDLSTDNNDNTKFDACMFRKWLTGRWRIGGATTPTDEELKLNGNKDCPYPGATATVPNTALGATFPTLFDGVTISNSSLLNQTIEGDSTNGVRYEVSVSRKEDITSGETILNMTSTGIIRQVGEDISFRKLAQVAKISSRAYDGDRFAMLTNATNCSFCHLHIDTMQRAYADPNEGQMYNRARVAVLESGLSLTDGWHSLDTFVAGTLYARGPITAGDHVYAAAWAKDAGGAIKPGLIKAGPVSDGVDGSGNVINGIRGNYLSNTDTSDTAKAANIVDASTTTGAKTPFAKIYSNYPKENGLSAAKYGGEWPDGPVPDNFPTVITESTTSTDGLISDSEWTSYLASAPKGKIVAGTNTRIFGVRRPSSISISATVSTTPVSYDPTSFDVNSALYATTVQGSSTASTFPAQLTQFITDVRSNNTAGITTFTTNWKGWLLQQALASPNNRDLQAGVASITTSSGVPINWPTINGVAANNFHVRYNPTTQAMTLTYRDFKPEVAAVPPTTVVNPPVTTGNTTCGSSFTKNCPAPSSPTTSTPVRTFTSVQAWLVASKSSVTYTSAIKNFAPGATISCAATNFTFSPALPASPNFVSCQYKYTYTTTTTTAGTAAVPETAITPVISIPITEADLFPQASNMAQVDLVANGIWDGNVIIDAGRIGDVGQDRAVTINGTIHINGDVVIRGQVKGQGRIVARGNIYVVGDLVYGCGDHACRITESDPTMASYRNWRNLPLLGLLAGGNVIVGDYDFPDYRATNNGTTAGGGVYDLVNDQVGRNISDATATTGIPGGSTGFANYSIPGATGTNTNGGSGMGFVPMIAANANWKNRSGSAYVTTTTGADKPKRYFQQMPFGFIVGRSGFGSYENGGAFVDTVGNSTVISMYPSNGSISIGNPNATTQRGFIGVPGTAAQLGASLSCTGSTASVQAARFGAGTTPFTVPFNYGFYCPPSSMSNNLRYLRNSSSPTSGDPSTNTTVWTQQSPQNAGLDSGAGMTTGWLGGLVGRPNGGSFTQIGDLSQSRLLKLMWLTTMEVNRDVDPITAGNNAGPLRTDGIFYSPHGIFSLARSYQNTWVQTDTASVALASRANTGGRWIHNGSVVAAELGFLITADYKRVASDTSAAAPFTDENLGGDHVHQKYANRNPTMVNFLGNTTEKNVGPAMGIYYDERLAGFLKLTSGVPVQIQRTGGYQQVSR